MNKHPHACRQTSITNVRTAYVQNASETFADKRHTREQEIKLAYDACTCSQKLQGMKNTSPYLQYYAMTKTGLLPTHLFLKTIRQQKQHGTAHFQHTFKRTEARNVMPTQIYHKEESLQAATFGSQMYHQWHEFALRSQSSPISHCYETGEAQNQWDTPLILSLCCAS